MVEKEELKRFWEVGKRPHRRLWKEEVDNKMDSLDRAGTWDVVDKVEGEKEDGSKWLFKVKIVADESIDKFKAQLVAQGFTQRLASISKKSTLLLFILIPCHCYLLLR
jgi:hypothetical protein